MGGFTMVDALLFSVDGINAVPARRISLAEAGLLERKHLQQWVIDHPELIGRGIKVVAFEYGRWASAGGSSVADRLDVLGLDRTGRLVVVELKRDQARRKLKSGGYVVAHGGRAHPVPDCRPLAVVTSTPSRLPRYDVRCMEYVGRQCMVEPPPDSHRAFAGVAHVSHRSRV
jgi:endonuclease NucS-like protein